VARIVTFGDQPAAVPATIIDLLRQQDEALQQQPQRHFLPGEPLRITQGPFTGIEAVYQMADGERRALVLIDMLNKPVALKIDVGSLRKID
jgi:transcriptional antiterminator RfaH